LYFVLEGLVVHGFGLLVYSKIPVFIWVHSRKGWIAFMGRKNKLRRGMVARPLFGWGAIIAPSWDGFSGVKVPGIQAEITTYSLPT
jgi:hypothetical protein